MCRCARTGEYEEIIDSATELERKLDALSSLMQEHKGKVVFFTGAGVSTGAGILIPFSRHAPSSRRSSPSGYP